MSTNAAETLIEPDLETEARPELHCPNCSAPRRFLTIGEAAENVIGIPWKHLKRLVKAGKVPAVIFLGNAANGSKDLIRLDRDSLERWMNEAVQRGYVDPVPGNPVHHRPRT